MHSNLKKSIITAALLLTLSACGGGGGSSSTGSTGTTPANAAPTLSVGKSSVTFESGQSTTITVAATDDNSTPTVAVTSVSPGVSASLSGGVLTVSGAADKTSVQGTVVLTATEGASTQLTSTQQISVLIYPKVEIFALVSGSQRASALSVAYGKPLTFSVVDANNEALPFTHAGVKNSDIAKASYVQNQITLTALKSGQTDLEISGTLPSGQPYVKTLQVTASGNQTPSLKVSPVTVSVQENSAAQIEVMISDPDGSAFSSGVLSAKSADSTIATASIQNGVLSISGVKAGFTQVTTTLVDGEYSVTANVAVTITQEALPTIVVNNNELIEIEEDSSLSVPISITGPRASEFKASAEVKSVNGNASDLSYKVENNLLVINSKRITSAGAPGRVSFSVTASATNGKSTIKSLTTGLDLIAKTNGVAIFEFPNKFGNNIMISRSGTSTVKITVNDDNVKQVTMFTPEPWFNNSAAGTYTTQYDDTTRTLTLTLTGFERNERFGIYLSYKDGNLGGKFSVSFRTYDLTATDKEAIEVRALAIAKTEAARSYQWIAKMYAEHLENIGVVDAQYVDEVYDQLRVDDSDNMRFTTMEYYINQAMEQVYSNEFNSGATTVETLRQTFNGMIADATTINRDDINTINEMADKSNGKFPRLNFETELNTVNTQHYSKFFGNNAYGEMVNGKWQYSTAYQFLSAIDAKVNETAQKRTQQ